MKISSQISVGKKEKKMFYSKISLYGSASSVASALRSLFKGLAQKGEQFVLLPMAKPTSL